MDASDELLRRAEPSALLYPDGIVRSLNAPMATALGRPAEECVGRYAWELVPESQRGVVERIVAHARKQRLAMRVLELPGPGGASLVALVEARPTTAAGGEQLVFGMIRDDTQHEARRKEMLATLGAERRRANDIAEFSSALITTATEQELQQVVLTRLAATFSGTGAALALADNGHLIISSDGGLPEWYVDAVRSVSLDEERPLPQAIRTGEPLFIADHEELLRRWPHSEAVPLGWPGPDVAMSITPLGPGGDRPLGAWVVTHDSKHLPSSDERTFMLTLAELAGQALGRIRSQQARLELATAVQHHMLPTLPERLPGLEVAARYRPCRTGLDIGGDWYDAFLMPDGTVALEIGDAQGHDVDAAAFMGQVRGSLRAIAAHEPDPGTVLAHANQLLVAMGAARFASCTMLHIDTHNGQVTGASAGHVPLLCAHDDGSHAVRRLPGGPVLGILPDADYPQETFTLDKHTALVMVTDGVVEGPDRTLDAGLEHAGTLAAQALHDGLSAEETADRVLDDAVAMNSPDDLAVLVVRRT
ncbi:SpoIIE family protein phosphatase [Streptomyces chiangmaiensis]|uniref:SpoIIE family protein phosphatase n=1 Tax=Streptomyces chiangmaiensis TaxID=766497 RepID=A0ABU7FPP9_9ACTN|nr:SpoIIE family protein phosphatase [Streptomyces chiangmaiensis]MED7826047.1 SpoIIE family protein phosphatase [Streptomyces chiangmaiensis]